MKKYVNGRSYARKCGITMYIGKSKEVVLENKLREKGIIDVGSCQPIPIGFTTAHICELDDRLNLNEVDEV